MQYPEPFACGYSCNWESLSNGETTMCNDTRTNYVLLIQECFLVGDPGTMSVCLFCLVESGKLEVKVLWWCGLVGGGGW
jgi:hypothetical protein